ncbi:Protein FAM57A, partial [Operophtera brumata]
MTLFELLNILCLFTGAGNRFRLKYSLSCGDVLDITNKVVSAVQAAFCCITGAIVCAWSCTRDFMRASHYMSEAYAWFGAAYFFYDIWSMYMVHVQMNSSVDYLSRKLRRPNGEALKKQATSFMSYCTHEPVILFHHLFIGGFGFLVIVASKAYILNGLAMLATFFFCRVASLPYVCLIYSRELGLSYLEISILVLLLPQLYWFYLMSSGALKIFFRKADKNANKSAKTSAN